MWLDLNILFGEWNWSLGEDESKNAVDYYVWER